MILHPELLINFARARVSSSRCADLPVGCRRRGSTSTNSGERMEEMIRIVLLLPNDPLRAR
jgi:hypothetical protein